MANEITHNYVSGLNLYACRFQPDGDVFLTDGASDEVWGTGGRDADAYDVAMTEEATSGHYKADFDAGANIAAGVYPVVIRVGSPPANGDTVIGQGIMSWNGTAEMINAIDEIIEGTITLRQAQRAMLAVLASLSSGGGSNTLIFRDTGDTKDRITATVDRDGNRTVVVRDLT